MQFTRFTVTLTAALALASCGSDEPSAAEQEVAAEVAPVEAEAQGVSIDGDWSCLGTEEQAGTTATTTADVSYSGGTGQQKLKVESAGNGQTLELEMTTKLTYSVDGDTVMMTGNDVTVERIVVDGAEQSPAVVAQQQQSFRAMIGTTQAIKVIQNDDGSADFLNTATNQAMTCRPV
ncbi:MAG: hypothetical protein AAFR65_14170 [Pseudomonadota bacterium]